MTIASPIFEQAAFSEISYSRVVDAIAPRQISPSFDFGDQRGPHLLPALQHISVDLEPHEFCERRQFAWFDPIAGVGGVGVITLAQHVLRIHSWREAARQIAMFLEPGGGVFGIHARFLNDIDRVFAKVEGTRHG